MSWEKILGQPAAVAYLRAALRGNRAPHGYLFYGPAGVGKRTAAVALAQALLCHEPPKPGESCGACQSCRWIDGRAGLLTNHPDLLPLLKNPETEKEKALGDQEQIIPLETVQDICKKLSRSPMTGPKRVAIIPEAHRMCGGQAEGANAFLKTLEEPPASSIVILTSSRPEALLETIVSRVQPVRFRRLAGADIRKGLSAAGFKRAEADLALAAALADGSLGRAKELLEGDLGKWRGAIMGALAKTAGAQACPGFGLALWALAEAEGERLFEAAEHSEAAAAEDDGSDDAAPNEAEEEAAAKTASGWKRFVFRRLLELCEVAFRDALVLAAGAEDGAAVLLQPDQEKLARDLAQRFGEDGCARMLETLREAHFATRLYVRGDLVGRVLAGRMVEAQRRA
ncbi:MAG: AAA family ATPase [Planctomycetes bacterium]|nr:AAA family ATPase [Planctomycetota bacterium]